MCYLLFLLSCNNNSHSHIPLGILHTRCVIRKISSSPLPILNRTISTWTFVIMMLSGREAGWFEKVGGLFSQFDVFVCSSLFLYSFLFPGSLIWYFCLLVFFLVIPEQHTMKQCSLFLGRSDGTFVHFLFVLYCDASFLEMQWYFLNSAINKVFRYFLLLFQIFSYKRCM